MMLKNLATVFFLCAALPLAGGVVLFDNGKSSVSIVTGKNPSAVVQFAAKELAYFLGKAGKCKIPVAASAEEGVRIYLGVSPESRKAGVVPVGNEHIISIRRDGRIFLAGVDSPVRRGADIRNIFFNINEKGTLETVYLFLEKYLGIRFLEPGRAGEYIPVLKKSVLPVRDEKITPAFHERRTHYYQGVSYKSYRKAIPDLDEYATPDETILWGIRLRYTSYRAPVFGCHTHAYLKLEQLFEKHPELFALQQDGERTAKDLCWSHPGVTEMWYKFADAWLRGDKDMSSAGVKGTWNRYLFKRRNEFMIDPHDYTEYYCRCRRCTDLRKPYGENGQGELIWKVVFDVARRIGKKHPGKFITTLVYPPKRFVPSDKNVPANLRVRITVPWTAISVGSKPWHDVIKLIRDWNSIQKEKVYLWMYLRANFGSVLHGVPEFAARNMQQFLKEVKPYTQGVFLEHIEPTHTMRNIDQYMLSRQFWDPDFDLDKCLAEYCRLYFGKGGTDMFKFYSILEKKWYVVAKWYADSGISGGVKTSPFLGKIYDQLYNYNEIIAIDRILDSATGKVAKKSVEAKRIDRFRRHVMGLVKEEFSLHSSDKKNSFKPIQYCCLPVLDSAPQTKDFDRAAWQYLHTNDRALKLSKENRFKLLESGDKLYLKVRFDDNRIAGSATPVRPKGNFSRIWYDNHSETFMTGKSGKTVRLVVNDRGLVAIYDAGKNRFLQDVPGLKVTVRCDSKGWGFDAVIDKSVSGYTPGSNLDRFNITRTRYLKGVRNADYFTFSKDAVGRWANPNCHSIIRRVKSAAVKTRYSGNARAATDRAADVLLGIADSRRSQAWRYWIPRGSKTRPGWAKEEGVKAKGCRMLDYTRELPSSGQVSSWKLTLPLPDRGSMLRVSCYVKADTVNPNASAFLAVGWNDSKKLWVKRGGKISGDIRVPLTGQWQKISCEIPVPERRDVRYISVTVGGRNIAPGKFFFDCVQIEKIKE